MFQGVGDIFSALECSGLDKKTFTVFQLTYSSTEWWEVEKVAMGEEAIGEMSWEVFRVKFLENYFLESEIYQKEVEFTALVHGSKTI